MLLRVLVCLTLTVAGYAAPVSVERADSRTIEEVRRILLLDAASQSFTGVQKLH